MINTSSIGSSSYYKQVRMLYVKADEIYSCMYSDVLSMHRYSTVPVNLAAYQNSDGRGPLKLVVHVML